MKALKWIIGLFVFAALFGLTSRLVNGPAEEKPVDPVADSIAQRTARIDKGFSSLDGSHKALTAFVKEAMNDPGSYEHDETRYRQIGQDTLLIIMKFRGKNAFGGVVRNTVTAYADLDGKLISTPKFDR